jgi:hypothetical protein
MKTSRTHGRAAALLAVLLATQAGARAGHAGEPPPPPLDGAGAAPQAEARQAFQDAERHFGRGEYRQAVPLFRRAYQLTGAPALVFDVAQAYRRAGDCREALAAYREFLALAAEPELRSAALEHLETLQRTCQSSGPVAPPAAVILAPPAPEWPVRSRRGAGLVTGGAGLVAGLAAGGLYLWNGARYDRWRDEDHRLVVMRGQPGAAAFVSRQQANDELWRSIHRTDSATLALGIAGAALTAAGGLLWYFGPRRPSVAMALHPLGVQGSVRW